MNEEIKTLERKIHLKQQAVLMIQAEINRLYDEIFAILNAEKETQELGKN